MSHLPPGGMSPREEPVDGGPDPGLVLLALAGADAHYCWAPFWPAAVSISVRTRLARS